MWGLAPDYQMLQADGQGEERTRLMVALIGLQKAPKPGNRKKKKASLTAQGIRPTGLPKHRILCAWFGSWVPESGFWLNISSKAFRNGVHEKKKERNERKKKNISTMRKRELLLLGFSCLESPLHRRLCLDVLFVTCGSQYVPFCGTANKLFCKHPGVPGLVPGNHYTGKLMLMLFIYSGRQWQGFRKQHHNFRQHRTKTEKLKNLVLFCPDKQTKLRWAIHWSKMNVWPPWPYRCGGQSLTALPGSMAACWPAFLMVPQVRFLRSRLWPDKPSSLIPVLLLLQFCVLLSTTPSQYFVVAHR